MRRLLFVAAACHAAGRPWRKKARDTGREARKRAARRLEALFHAFDAEETKPDGFMVGGKTDGAGQNAERSWEFHRPEKIKKVMNREARANMAYRANVTSPLLLGGSTPADAYRFEERRRRAMQRARAGGDVCKPMPRDWSVTSETDHTNWTIPELQGAAEATAANVRRAIDEWGAVIVRGFLPDADERTQLRALIDHAFDAQLDGRNSYQPPDDLFDRFEHLIMAVLSGQGLLAAYVPTAAEFLLKRFEAWGLLKLLRDYFGEEPAISSKKWTLRRGSGLTFPGWHQDGFFMDKGSRYLNMWLALSDCGAGTDRPGLTVIPKRVAELLPVRNYIVLRHRTLQERFNKLTVTPRFRDGDLFLFDEYYIHTTQFHFGDHEPGVYRYAIETWFHSRCTVDNAYSLPLAWGW